MIGRFEHDMSEAVDALRQEKDRSAQAVEELNEKVGHSFLTYETRVCSILAVLEIFVLPICLDSLH